MKKGVKVHGWDVSLNHAAFVELIDGKLANFWYVTDKVGSANRSKEHGTRLPNFKSSERQQNQMARLAFLENFIDKKILMPNKPDYVGIEDYAIRAEQGAHYLGEIGGIGRILCWFRGVSMRLHDPISTKMFVTHDGTAQKDLVESCVSERWGIDFSEYNQPAPKPNAKNPEPKQNRQTSEDLADAYTLAMMVWTEVQLRHGLIRLSDLHTKEIQVFNRVTKTYPVSLLDRDWIINPDGGTDTPHGEPVCPECGSRKCCLAGEYTPEKQRLLKRRIEKWR